MTPHFASWQTLNVNLTQVATIVIVSVGMTLVIATGGIDLSVGSLMAIAGALAPLIFLSSVRPSPIPVLGNALAFVVPIGAAGLLGAVQRLVHHALPGPADRRHAGHVHRRARHRAGVDQRQPAGVQESGVPVHRPRAGLRRAVPGRHHAGAGRAAAWTLRRTLFGRQILSVGGNERAARLSGVPVDRVKRWVYAISGLCAGIAGLVVMSINSSSDANLVGLGMELDAIAAVAVGGTPFTGGQANVVGSLIGALLIQLLRYTLLANGVPDAAALVVKGAIIARRRLVAAAGPIRMSAATANATGPARPSGLAWAAQQRVLIALVAAHPLRRAALRPLPRRLQRPERARATIRCSR